MVVLYLHISTGSLYFMVYFKVQGVLRHRDPKQAVSLRHQSAFLVSSSRKPIISDQFRVQYVLVQMILYL